MRSAAIVLPALLLAAASCGEASAPGTAGGPDSAAAGTPGALARPQLDSGNVAFREARYREALRHYRDAARIDENESAAWFGIYMAESALGNRDAADEAIRRARELAPADEALADTAGAATAGAR